MANIDWRGGEYDGYVNIEIDPEEGAALVYWWRALTDVMDPSGNYLDKDLKEEWLLANNLMQQLQDTL